MASTTIGFSIREEDRARLDHLVERFAGGTHSLFLRLAMKHMEVLERAEQLRELQRYGVQQRAAAGLADVGVKIVVHRLLSKKGGAAQM